MKIIGCRVEFRIEKDSERSFDYEYVEGVVMDAYTGNAFVTERQMLVRYYYVKKDNGLFVQIRANQVVKVISEP